MGLQVEFNYVLKLKHDQGFPPILKVGLEGYGIKDGYRIYPINTSISLMDEANRYWGTVIIYKLVQTGIKTFIYYRINKVLVKQAFATRNNFTPGKRASKSLKGKRVRKMPLDVEDIKEFESIDWGIK